MDKPVYIDVDKIDPNPYQPRLIYDAESMEELKQSIKELGIINPIVVRPLGERYQLVSGSRRLKAAKELGLKKVPAIIRQLSDRKVMEITLTENLQRKDLNPIEEALGFQKLIEEFGYTHEELARRLGKSRSYISNSLRLLKLSWKVKLYVMYGVISAWHARVLIPLSERLQNFFADLIVDWGLTVRETQENVKRYLGGAEFLEWQREIPIDAVDTSLATHLWDYDDESVKEMANSIKNGGLLNPIHVLVTAELIDGCRRLMACKRLGWKLIPAVIQFPCKWVKMIEQDKGNIVLRKTSEIKPNPILTKLEEMKVEPYYSYSQDVERSLIKVIMTIQQNLEANRKG